MISLLEQFKWRNLVSQCPVAIERWDAPRKVIISVLCHKHAHTHSLGRGTECETVRTISQLAPRWPPSDDPRVCVCVCVFSSFSLAECRTCHRLGFTATQPAGSLGWDCKVLRAPRLALLLLRSRGGNAAGWRGSRERRPHYGNMAAGSGRRGIGKIE